mgnify:CR=1 FL=1
MNLFIDSISSPSYICIFDNNRNIIWDISIDVKWNESSKIIPELSLFLENNNISHNDIENTVIVHGPGSFTWVRTTVLIANTLNYVIKKHMTTLSYFDLFENYPIIKSSSRRDHFVKLNISSNIEIIENELLEKQLIDDKIKVVYWESWFEFQNIEILEKIDYNHIIKELELKKDTKIEPLYIKKPNIS